MTYGMIPGEVCYSGHELYDKMHAKPAPTSTLDAACDAAQKLRNQHRDISIRLSALRMAMDEAWQGEASQTAKAEMKRFEEYSAQVSENLEPSTMNFQAQSNAFIEDRDRMEKTSDKPPEGDSFSFLPGRESEDEKRAEWNAVAQRNVEIYQGYTNTTQANTTQLVTEYPKPTFNSSDAEFSRSGSAIGGGAGTAPTASGGAGTTVPAGAAPAGSGGSTTAPGVGGTGAAGAGGAGSGGAAAGGSGTGAGGRQGGVRLPDGSIRYPDGTIRRPDGSLVRPDGTVIPPSGTSASGLGAGRAAGDFGPTGSGAGGAGGMAAGGMVAGGMAGAGGAAGGGPGGAGAYSGQGQFGPTGSGGAAGAAGGQAGAGGARPMGGGMMGAGGGRGGQGGGDEEHERKFVQDEQLDSGLPVMRDEHGEKEYDPVTGMVIIDGVIGE